MTFTATVSPQIQGTFDNGGTVTFSDGSTSLGTASLSNGQATYSAPSSVIDSVTTHTITASYSGDTNFTTSSNSVLQTVNLAGTTTAVSASTNPSVFGQSVTLTATVTPGSGTFDNGGTVTFSDGSTSLGTASLSGNQATFAAPSAAATHTITASYSGDTNFTGNSGSMLQTVYQATTSTTLAPPVGTSTFGQLVTFTATVTNTSFGSNTAPVGAVTFKDGGLSIGQALLSGSATIATATFTTSSLSFSNNPHTLTAAYNGDGANFFASAVSNSVTQTVSQATTTTTLAVSPNPSAFGQSVTFTATCSGQWSVVSGQWPTGTVTFSDGSTSLGTASLSSGQATLNAPLSVIDILATHVITASYSGDTNFTGSGSGSVLQTVNAASTTTSVSASANPFGVRPVRDVHGDGDAADPRHVRQRRHGDLQRRQHVAGHGEPQQRPGHL